MVFDTSGLTRSHRTGMNKTWESDDYDEFTCCTVQENWSESYLRFPHSALWWPKHTISHCPPNETKRSFLLLSSSSFSDSLLFTVWQIQENDSDAFTALGKRCLGDRQPRLPPHLPHLPPTTDCVEADAALLTPLIFKAISWIKVFLFFFLNM